MSQYYVSMACRYIFNHVVCVCPLELFDDVLQLATMALCAEESPEAALALLDDAFKVVLQCGYVTVQGLA